jgi:epoxyqueuosine reductase
MLKQLFAQLTEWGYQGRMVPIQHLADLQEEIEGRHRQGLFDQELYQIYLAEFAFRPPGTPPGARSILVVAVPQPKIEVTFVWQGERLRTIVPPTYGEAKKDRRIAEQLAQALEPMGHWVTLASLPKKLLAVRSGLAAYGKNNITYVPGMGSFHGLVAVYSDAPAPNDEWRTPQMMEACQNCSACQRHCPTGAISSDRFLLHAEHCITFHNEKPRDVPFPAWMDPAWHNCLVGCLHCQRICPQNREVWSWVQGGPAFTEQETSQLVDGVPLHGLSPQTVGKLEQLDWDALADVLPRNLGALLSGGPSHAD